MPTIINININGQGVSQSKESGKVDADPYRDYPLLPGFTMVRDADGFRKLKAKKKKNCSNGQVCGFSCISKTKTCIANMTTAQLMAHNEAKRQARREKVAAKKAEAGGAVIVSSSEVKTYQEAIERGKAIAGKHLEQIKPLAEKIAALNAEDDRLQAEIKRVQQESKTFWDNVPFGQKAEMPYDFDEKISELIKQQDKVFGEFTQLKKEPDALAEQALKEIQKRSGVNAIAAKKIVQGIDLNDSLDLPRLERDENGDVVPPGKAYRHGKETLKADMAEFYRLTGGKGKFGELYYLDDRASAHEGLNLVNIGSPIRTQADIKKTLFHEIGHHVEFQDKNAQRIAREWVESKAEGPPKKLSELVAGSNYGDSEIAYPDKFSNPYVGKKYDDGATEVLSMGLERWSSPQSLSNHFMQDSSHVYLVIGLVSE